MIQQVVHRTHSSAFKVTYRSNGTSNSVSFVSEHSSFAIDLQIRFQTTIEKSSTRGRHIDHPSKRFRLQSITTLSESTDLQLNDTKASEYDAIVIGSGMGGLTVATQLASKGQSVLLLEKYDPRFIRIPFFVRYIVPGGSASYYKREGYTFDVGSSMMFGFGSEGTTNLITKALETVGKTIETIPDPTQIHYHLPATPAHPDGLEIYVWRDYEAFLKELMDKFPHEKEGIKAFYDECWTVFNSLNVLELKSLEEPRYLLEQFSKHPIACLQLAARVLTNTGEVARRYIKVNTSILLFKKALLKDEELLKFIDMECFCWSTVSADLTPLINAGMVFCDRHFGGINYPKGGVGQIPIHLAQGFEEKGGTLLYKANVKRILTETTSNGDLKAVGVQLANGRTFK